MKSLFFFAFLQLVTSLAFGQLSENFDDGDFSSPVSWTGTPDRFVIVDGQLQLNDTNAGSPNIAYLSTAALTSSTDSTTWHFLLELDFSPSSSNFARIYLSAESPDLTANQAAYFLQTGGISGDQDALQLFRQDADGTLTEILSGTAGAVGTGPVRVAVRLSRNSSGQWFLFADYNDSGSFLPEGQGEDATYTMGNYFGFYCKYSSTRSDKFRFDDVLINPLFLDSNPPSLLSVTAVAADSLLLSYSENMDTSGSLSPESYLLQPGNSRPAEVSFLPDDKQQIVLQLETPLQNQTQYELLASGPADQAGNVLADTSFTFTFIQTSAPQPGDLLITEFFPDPTPTQGLPEAEFIELYNASDKILDLEGIGIASGGNPALLPSYQLLPGAYVIICDDSDETAFAPFGAVAIVSSLPSLSNASDEISITTSDGSVLDRVSYTDDWYQDAEREDGGWSLERIFLDQPSECRGNWRASISEQGGTPGQLNSVDGLPIDLTAPQLLSVLARSATEIDIKLDDAALPLLPEQIELQPVVSVMEVLPTDDPLVWIALLDGALQSGQSYTIQISGLEDCSGNRQQEPASLQTGLPEPALEGDLLINELLFNPQSGGKDFIELYNTSGKIINLQGLELLNTQKETGTNQTQVTEDVLFFPQTYLVLTESIADIRSRYIVPEDATFLETRLPTLEDKSGNITLRQEGLSLDALTYQEEWHSTLLEKEEGVSLERLSKIQPTQDPANWHSAASTAGFATPGYENSQQVSIASTEQSELIQLSTERFSPDGDGFEDVLLLKYQTDQPGYLLNLRIFDAHGREVRRLYSNHSLASQGLLQWDGSNDEGTKARTGIYILWMELFTPTGDKTIEKKSCVLAGQLD